MKYVKLLLLLVITTISLHSCKDNDPIAESEIQAKKSVALRTYLNETKQLNGLTGKLSSHGKSLVDTVYCFDFVYPIQLQYSDDSIVSVNNHGALLSLLENETPNLYINGIVMPFQIVYTNGNALTINSESEFLSAVAQCDDTTFSEYIGFNNCFTYQLPVSFVNTETGQTYTFNSYNELNVFVNGTLPNSPIDFVYPFTVVQNQTNVTINSIYDFFTMINNCNACNCYTLYEPVCVDSGNGIVQYGNACYALCDGYTEADFVTCNPAPECSITNLTVTVGECNVAQGTYAITINFSYENESNILFDVRDVNNQLVGFYNLTDLPVTIENYTPSGQANDFVKVQIHNSDTCYASTEWAAPDCNCNCTTEVNPVCVSDGGQIITFDNICLAFCAGYTQADVVNCGTAAFTFSNSLGNCFTMVYPLQVNPQGTTYITVNNDQELLNFYYPSMNQVPIMVYPITVNFSNGQTITFNNESAFVEYATQHCP